jgi:hypothetical protein
MGLGDLIVEEVSGFRREVSIAGGPVANLREADHLAVSHKVEG